MSNNTVDFLFWNVAGVIGKPNSFWESLNKVDVFCLAETWFDGNVEQVNIPNKVRELFEWMVVKGERKSKFGRISRGFIIGIKKDFKCKTVFRAVWNNKYMVKFAMRINDRPHYCLFVYIPGEEWNEGKKELWGKGVREGEVGIIMGDFNSRIGKWQFNVKEGDIVLSEMRNSRDGVVNSRGRDFLDGFGEYGHRVLNGEYTGDLLGEYTFVMKNGSSVIDLALCHMEMLGIIVDFEVINLCFSDHFPIMVRVGMDIKRNRTINKRRKRVKKANWSEELASNVIKEWQGKLGTKGEKEVIDIVELQDLGKEIGRHLNIGSRCEAEVNKGWFDEKCKEKLKVRDEALNKWRKSGKSEEREDFVYKRNEAKSYCRAKRRRFFGRVRTGEQWIKNRTMFWKYIKGIRKGEDERGDEIKDSEWFEFFKSKLGTERQYKMDDGVFRYCKVWGDADLDKPFSVGEVERALDGLKCGKSGGSDGVSNEIYKGLKGIGEKMIAKCFTEIYEKGGVPNEWLESEIVPIFKKGCKEDVNNYRGVSLNNGMYKVFTFVLNERLKSWVAKKNLLGESQFGFRAGFSTEDAIFVLDTIIQKRLKGRGGKVFVSFIDFKAAFDSVDRDKLWEKLLKLGCSYKMVQCIGGLYEGHRGRVKRGVKKKWFDIGSGVKQGCILSPLLFALFIQDLEERLRKEGGKGSELEEGVE